MVFNISALSIELGTNANANANNEKRKLIIYVVYLLC